MKFKNLITSLVLAATSASSSAAHVQDRSVYMTDIVTAAGVSIIKIPTAATTAERVMITNSDNETTSSSMTLDSTLTFLGVGLSGAAPTGMVDAGLPTAQTVSPVVNGTGLLENLTSANNPPSGLSSFEDTGGSGYIADGSTYCYIVYTYTILNSVRFGSGSSQSCFGDSNDGVPFAAQSTWGVGGGLNGQVIIKTSPGNIAQNISAGASSFTDSNNMTNDSSPPMDVVGNAYHSDGSVLNITYNVYSYKLFNGTRVYAATPYAITITDPNDSGYYIPLIGWTTVPGVDGYRVIRSSDGLALDVTSPSAFYDSGVFVSWSGTNTVLPNSYVPPSVRVAGNVLQKDGNWIIGSDGTFNFFGTGFRLDNAGTLYTTGGIVTTGLNAGQINVTGPLNGGAVNLSGNLITSGTSTFGNTIILPGGTNFQLDVFGLGNKIGTATNQKLGFYNATPIVQPTGNIVTALNNLGLVGSAALPNPGAATLGGTQSKIVVSSQYLTGISTSGVVTAAQPAFSDISGTLPTSQLTNAVASFIQGFSGVLTSITANAIIGYGLLPRAITLQNMVGINNGTLVCTVNPQIILQDCGTSVSACTSGVTNKAAVTISNSNTGNNGTIINGGIAAGHYWAFQFSTGTCTASNINVSVEYVMQ